MQQYSIFWFRRDLRLDDNKGLFHALSRKTPVIPLFIFDTQIIESLDRNDARIDFIYQNISGISHTLKKKGKNLMVLKGDPLEIFKKLLEKYPITAVFTNKDHEPYGMMRDKKVEELLTQKGIALHSYLDHLLFEKTEVLKNDQTPYQVFTPYSKKCNEILSEDHLKTYPSEDLIKNFATLDPLKIPTLSEMGFNKSDVKSPPKTDYESIITTYHQTRDYPGKNGTTRLGVHLRFGTISLRKLAELALKTNDTYFNELLWREFYAMILWHYPQVVNNAFKPQYDRISWRNDPQEFERWKAGKTGYPMVDAGMRELATTGYMHNRIRMITASFLTKHLLIDWRWGENWFASRLLDFELSSNNGGWQWSAGSGCDAAPYFRIFNPSEQQKKFDPKGLYIQKWIPEYNTPQYPQPMLEHKFARERCLNVFKNALAER